MKTSIRISEMQIQQLISENNTFFQEHHNYVEILEETEAADLLRVSMRTMRRYRNKNYFHVLKLDGRILYIKDIFVNDLRKLCYR